MRSPLIPCTLLTMLAVLSACRQALPQSPAAQSQSTNASLAAFSGTVMDAPNEQMPKTLDSLEVAVSSGTMVATTVTADGTILTGDAGSPHRLVVFLDEDCLYCRRFLVSDMPWIQSTMVKTNGLAIERVFVPMTTDGTLAAKLALCAAHQEKFTEADAWLATHPLSDTALQKQFVKAVHLKSVQLQQCIAQKDLLAGNERRAAELKVERVPFFVLGKSSWLGLLSREELTRTIERALKP